MATGVTYSGNLFSSISFLCLCCYQIRLSHRTGLGLGMEGREDQDSARCY